MPNNGAGTMGTVYINNVVKQMKTDLRLIQEQQPLIHNITNYVAMNFVANSLFGYWSITYHGACRGRSGGNQ